MGGFKVISRTYIFLQGLSVVLQTYQGGSIEAPRPGQDLTSLLVVQRQPLKRRGLQGSCLPHPVQWKAVQGGRHEIRTANLKELALPPCEGVLEGGQEDPADIVEGHPK